MGDVPFLRGADQAAIIFRNRFAVEPKPGGVRRHAPAARNFRARHLGCILGVLTKPDKLDQVFPEKERTNPAP